MMEHNYSFRSQEGLEMLEKVRRICGLLPEAGEVIDGFGHTVFKVRGKTFIMMSEHDQHGLNLHFKSDRETQDILLQTGRFAKTPYIGQHGWVSVKQGETIDWNELEQLLKEAYLRAAPKRLIKQFQSGEA